MLWRGHPVPLRLDPLLVFREAELNEDVRFLNADRDGKQVEYLSYTSGKTERDPTTVAELSRLLALVAGHAPQPQPEESVADPAPLPPDFEILAEIGRGGMGVVYLARQISLGRLVALKLLPAELSGDEAALARFSREIRALGQCDDPHIVKVLTSGKFPDGQRYYAMEYVPGADLDVVWRELAGKELQAAASSLGSTTWSQAVLTACRKQRSETVGRAKGSSATGARTLTPSPSTGVGRGEGGGGDALGVAGADSRKAGLQQEGSVYSPEAAKLLEHLAPLPELPAIEDDPGGYARRVATLMRDAARALQSVHDQGIVHRDVKPANLMLSPDGTRVVLMDFGLAKGHTRTLEASRIGGLLGTLRYAAPEQLAAAQVKVGPKADVRGVGATLYELLTRRRLFDDAVDENQLAAWVLNRDVPRLRGIDPSLDRDLEAIVAAATEREQSDRLSARELADYLDLYLAGKPLPIRLPGVSELARRWVREHKGLVASAAMALVATVLVSIVAAVLIGQAKRKEAVATLEKTRLQAADAIARSFQTALDTADWSVKQRSSLESLLTEWQRLDSAAASAARARFYQNYASFLQAALERPRLEPDDVARIDAGLTWLAERAPADTGPVRELLRRRKSIWTPLIDLSAPYADAAKVFEPGRIQSGNGGLRRVPVAAGPSRGQRVATRLSSEGGSQLEVLFAPDWENSGEVGLLLNSRDTVGYAFVLLAIPRVADSSPSVADNFRAARSHGAAFVAEIRRNGKPLHREFLVAADVPDGSLRLWARHERDHLSFQIDTRISIEVSDSSPLRSRDGQFAVDWPPGATLTELHAAPCKPQSKPAPWKERTSYSTRTKSPTRCNFIKARLRSFASRSCGRKRATNRHCVC